MSGWELCDDLRDVLIAHVSWVGLVLYRSCTTHYNRGVGSTVDGVSDLPDISVDRFIDRDLFDSSEFLRAERVKTIYTAAQNTCDTWGHSL